MAAVVFAAGCIVPFDAQPGARLAGDWAYVADGAQRAVVGYALPYVMGLRHRANFSDIMRPFRGSRWEEMSPSVESALRQQSGVYE